MIQKSIEEEYLRLGPLQTRIEIHAKFSEREHDVEQDVLDAARLERHESLLDIGSGTGSFLQRLRSEGHLGRLCALDSSPAAVAVAAQIRDVEAVLGDACALSYDPGTFDVVTARHMLYHVDDPVLAIRETRRVLRPGGRFVAVVNHARSTPMIADIVRSQAVANGIEPPVLPISLVHSDNLPGMVESVFGTVTTVSCDNALVFRSPGPAVAFGLALMNFYGVADDDPRREAVAGGIAAAVEERFRVSGETAWRDPKGYVVCVARRDQSGRVILWIKPVSLATSYGISNDHWASTRLLWTWRSTCSWSVR